DLQSPLVIKDAGFETPESVFYDGEHDVYLVSNIKGSPSSKDGNGFVSRLQPDGTVIALHWISGTAADVTLNAPKGMAVSKGVLYVTDIDTVRMFDLQSGKPKGAVDFDNVSFLNDLSVDTDGNLYVSDTGFTLTDSGMTPTHTDAIWRICDGKAEKLVADPQLHRPNGLLADRSGVWVVTNGGAELYHIDAQGKRAASVTLPAGGLDGIIRTESDELLISSWEAKTVFRGDESGPFTPFITNVPSPADIGYDTKRNRLLIPIFQKNEIQIHPL
ncbi:MAG: SMP-30/gluconolactonase/LRE family protein, partial [Deltaproteobacteria bacterium]|nr:SMP-30/gluconolactonase/LRE family protein [Deltaproteobacteria bacterium]